MRIPSAVIWVCAGLFLVTGAPAHADTELQSYLGGALIFLRHRDHDPAIAALIQIDGKVEAEAAVGVRALGHPEPVTVDDRWHIGSDTKAFTATMIGTLVDQHVMSFDDTLEASFPALVKSMNVAYRGITVGQLLSHTAGLPTLTADDEMPPLLAAIKTAHGVSAQRAALARYFLTMPPASKAGEFKYSNVGFVIAGAIAEARTGKTWETLIRERIFAPLGITNAGFGPPGTPGKFDQPCGHRDAAGQLTSLDPGDTDSDNPALIGPAGTINIALKDWALFAQDQLDGAIGHGKLLKPATYRVLQTPVVDNVAMGWGVHQGPDGAPVLLTHMGSNGYWMAEILIYPEHDTVILMVTNSGNDVALKTIQDLSTSLTGHLKLLD
jgi:D-alanyl-D-alanine carboxypeptidase